MASKSPTLLTDEQRHMLTQIPDGLSERDIARYYTLTPQEIAFARTRNGFSNKLGIAVQLGMLRFPGRTLTDIVDIPQEILDYIAQQVDVPVEFFLDYGNRQPTLSNHLKLIRQEFGYRTYGWSEMLTLSRYLFPLALESSHRLPLIEAALLHLREHQIIAPGITTIERLVWRILNLAERLVYRWLTEDLSPENRNRLEHLLQANRDFGGKTPLAWLRAAPAEASARHLNWLLDRIDYLEELELPEISSTIHPNRIRQLASRARRYEAQPLARLKSEERRYALLVTHMAELHRILLDEAVDMFDRTLDDLMRRGKRLQEQYVQDHARDFNRSLFILTDAAEALLKAKNEALDPYATVFDVVDEETLATTVALARAMMRPPNMDFLDLIESRYTRRRKAMLRLYSTLSFRSALGHDRVPTEKPGNYTIRKNITNLFRIEMSLILRQDFT